MKTKTYIISSTKSVVKTKQAASNLLLGWENSGTLYDKCRIYEVTVKKVYRPRVVKSVKLVDL